MTAEEIAGEIISQTRAVIVMNMRFLDTATFRLRPAVREDVRLATDGDRLWYNPAWLLHRYMEEANLITRDYLHVLLHCIFRHPFVSALVDQSLWNLACDIAVEGLICELNLPQLATPAEIRRRVVTDQLRSQVKPLTAEKLYHRFLDDPPPAAWADLFHSDDHDVWYQPPQPSGQRAQGGGDGGQNSQNRQNQGSGGGGQKPQDRQNPDSGDGGQKPQDRQNPGGGGGGQKPQDRQDPGGGREPQRTGGSSGFASLAEEWRSISEHVQMDLATFSKRQGTGAGSIEQLLAGLNRERYDYEAFLKKFAVLGEVMRINDDEFDYIFYTYGLKRYGNMPLVEPLEYKETRRIREFVIAIDTSGSTSGELVQTFLNKTYNILMSTDSFFSRVNLHIIQCDAQIQQDVKITSREEFETYIRSMTIHGLGGTDFRPVFSYVAQLIQQREFRHLKGLIYFTDGYGIFPSRKPDYTTAFVFVQDEFSDVGVPPWAIKLVLEKDELGGWT